MTLFTIRQLYFNQHDIELIKQIKNLVKTLPTLTLLLDSDYLIIETDGCETGWEGALYRKLSKYDLKNSKYLCRYTSGKYKEK